MNVDIVRSEDGKDFNSWGQQVIECSKGCGSKTTMTGTGLCDACWEDDNRAANLANAKVG